VNRSHSPNPHELGISDRGYSLDTLPQEISTFGAGDFRITALRMEQEDGSQALQLRYKDHEVLPGKYALPGLPASYAEEEAAETLEVTMEDSEAAVRVTLLYGVLPDCDVITRALRVTNIGSSRKVLQKAGAMTLDFLSGDLDCITFFGKWAKERTPDRLRLPHGIREIGSVRGASSAHYNPSVILCDPAATETTGEAWGLTFVYSGEYQLQIEKDMICQTRVVLGIHPDDFSWTLQPGEEFVTPEAALTYSGKGLGELSGNFHDFIRQHIVRGYWRDRQRPVLINNWEGTYFDFTGDKLMSIAKDAADCGLGLFVLDDGWFGKRDDDNSGLGDWVPNEKKLGCTMAELGQRIRDTGVRFGIWFEPEMINEDSDLFRSHPDWIVGIPGRAPALSRNQLVLDLGRTEVQEYLIDCMTKVLSEAGCTYLKWDFNRSLCDKYSGALPAGRQGEMAHRFVLGTYRVLEELHTRFPELLIEGCSSGGCRFDCGMLCYTPQIWTSDDTDPIERLMIQYGTSFIYPVNTMGAHVSASPNHQTGRRTPLKTRSVVAMSGTFGYELDLNKMTEDEKTAIRSDVKLFNANYHTIEHGRYYRLLPPTNEACTAWEEAEKDGSRAILSVVWHSVKPNPNPEYVKLRGLQPGAMYRLSFAEGHGLNVRGENTPEQMALYNGEWTVSGAVLLSAGIPLPYPEEEFGSVMILIEKA